MENASATEILAKIKASKNILINMDTRTDYDALCCSIVMGRFIKSQGIKTTIIHSNIIGETFNQFFTFDEIKTNTDISAVELKDFDLIIFLDSGSRNHISLNDKFKFPENVETINIDHHITNEMYGKLNYIYHIGSCCSVLYQFFKENKIELSGEYLKILAIGVVTDTGFFKFDSTKPIDFRIAAELMEKGIKIWEIISILSSYEYIDQVKFKELVYRNLKIDFDKKYAYSTITLDELRSDKIDLTKVFVRHSDLIRYILGIDLSFVVAETESNPKYFELSFRSKDPSFDVCKIAEKFGGGGYKTGAGAKLYNVKSMDEALDTVLRALNL